MHTLIDHAVWLLSGGREPLVHVVNLTHHFANVNELQIPRSYAENDGVTLPIPAGIRKLTTKSSVNRMAIHGARPVQHVIPFHLSRLPIRGMTLPAVRVITRIRRFHPKYAINSFSLGALTKITGLARLPEYADILKRNFKMKYEKAIATPVKIIKPPVHFIDPHKIPRYFIRIKPTSFSYFKPSEIVLRRMGMASALGIPREKVEILAIFKNVEIISSAHIEYCGKTNTLVLRSVESLKRDIKPDIRDVVVGYDSRSGQVHIAFYRHRGES